MAKTQKLFKSIERVADYAVSISRVLSTINNSFQPEIAELIVSMYSKSLKMFEGSVKGLQKPETAIDYPFSELNEIERLNEIVVKEIVNKCKDIKTAVELRLVVESIKRVAEYSADIAEAAMNMKIR